MVRRDPMPALRSCVWSVPVYKSVFDVCTEKLPNTSVSLTPPPPLIETAPAGPKLGLPPLLTPTKVMSLWAVPPTIAMS